MFSLNFIFRLGLANRPNNKPVAKEKLKSPTIASIDAIKLTGTPVGEIVP